MLLRNSRRWLEFPEPCWLGSHGYQCHVGRERRSQTSMNTIGQREAPEWIPPGDSKLHSLAL